MRTQNIPFLRPGMYVRSRNGNTRMLVTCDNGDGSVICFWFCEERDRLVWQAFHCSELSADAREQARPLRRSPRQIPPDQRRPRTQDDGADDAQELRAR
ncbi:hypothetical protein AVXHC19_03640 [Acidovorax sacchari]